MGFFVLLETGASVQSTAKRFITQLIKRNQELKRIDLAIVSSFINDIMRFIGLNSAITAEELLANSENQCKEQDKFSWPEERHTYFFHFNSKVFARLEKFLVLICQYVMELTEDHIVALEAEQVSEDDDSPLIVFMELLSYWCSAYRHLQNTEQHTTSQFEEPLARINFHLLSGVHMLRMCFNDFSPFLHHICTRLLSSAVEGIFYKETNLLIVQGLLQMFENDFVVFHKYAPDTMSLYYKIFSASDQKKTWILTYKRLIYMLTITAKKEKIYSNPSTSSTPDTLLILTNCLVTNEMLEVYYNHLKSVGAKRLLITVLDFIKVLQSNLRALDIFSKEFIEAILRHVLEEDGDISSLAAELYITMMQRQFSDDIIFKHLMDFFVTIQPTPQLTDLYMQALWRHFSFMQLTTPYMKTIKTTQNDFTRFFTAHMLNSVYKYLLNNIEQNHKEISNMLKIMPKLMTKLNCQVTKNILLNIFAINDFDQLKMYIHPSQLMVFVTEFQRYAAKEFLNTNLVDFNFKLNVFTQFHLCLKYTKNWDILEIMANHVYQNFRRCELQLSELDDRNEESPSNEILLEYYGYLQQLNIILRLNYQIIDDLNYLYQKLSKRLLTQTSYSKYTKRMKLIIDVHVIEILTSCIRNFTQPRKEEANKCRQWCQEARNLMEYLFSYLCYSNEKDMLKQPLVLLCTVFNSIIMIYSIFNLSTSQYTLKIESHPFNILINVLITLIFNTPIQQLNKCDSNGKTIQTNAIYDLQRSMIQNFTRLQTLPLLDMVPTVWKICIFYGRREYNMFKNELFEFLCTLAKQHFDVYRHSLIVLVYNLHKRKPPLKDSDILGAIRAHARLIDNRALNIEQPELLRVNTVLGVLQAVKKSLSVYTPKAEQNRLAALKHLHFFTKPLNVNAGNVLQDIRQQAEILRKHSLTASEELQLVNFLKHY